LEQLAALDVASLISFQKYYLALVGGIIFSDLYFSTSMWLTDDICFMHGFKSVRFRTPRRRLSVEAPPCRFEKRPALGA
jgi:hypothetical protein